MYLSVYSSIYAPIENCFAIIKSFMKKKWKDKDIKINLKNNNVLIYEALKSIKSCWIKSLYANLYSRLRLKLNNLALNIIKIKDPWELAGYFMLY